jgi:hypothetical protein
MAGAEVTDVLRPRALVEGNWAAMVGHLRGGVGLHETQPRLDGRDILGVTARVVGSALGEVEIDTSIALTQLYVEQGSREDWGGEATKKQLVRIVFGARKDSGRYHEMIHLALVRLWRLEIHFRAFNAAEGRAMSDYVRFLSRVRFDEQINLLHNEPSRYDPAAMGRRWKGTVEFWFDPYWGRQLQAGYWIAVDWEKLHRFKGLPKTLWLVFNAPSARFTPVAGDPRLEQIGLPLVAETYRAFGINRARDRDCWDALRKAGKRLTQVDSTYVGCDVVDDPAGRPGVRRLVVTRRRGAIEMGPAASQLHLAM